MEQEDLDREFALQQYEMLEKEALEIHARSDRLEQVFAAAYGALYAFYFKGPSCSGPGCEGVTPGVQFWFLLVPCFVAGFAMLRLDLLSHVRRIIRAYQREIEKAYPVKEGDAITLTGKVGFFDEKFYATNAGLDKFEQRSVWLRFVFRNRVSDRAVLWRLLFWISVVVFLLNVPGSLQNLRAFICALVSMGPTSS